jgi:ATP-binding cassette subfamily F protein 3
MAGLTETQGGARKLGYRTAIQYFGQEPWRTLTMTNTVLEELESVSPDEMRPRLRTLLGSMLFTGDDVEKKVQVLSGGEKCRLAIAKMLVRPANFLLLDEPTNHLDVSSREVLEEALSQYTGTFCFVSHDRRFMDRLANKVLEVSDGGLKFYLGNYSDYLLAKEREGSRMDAERQGPGARTGTVAAHRRETARRARRGASGGTSASVPDAAAGGRKTRQQRRQEALARQTKSKAKRARREKRTAVLEEINLGEKRLEEIEVALADPAIYKDGSRAKLVVNEQRALLARMEELYAMWEELED